MSAFSNNLGLAYSITLGEKLQVQLCRHCILKENKRSEKSRLRRSRILPIRFFLQDHKDGLSNGSDLYEILNLYKSLREAYQQPSKNKCPLNWILHYIVEQTLCLNHDDSNFVKELMEFVLENDGEMGYLLVLSKKLLHDLYNHQTALEYFLEHARREKIIFRGRRLVSADVYWSNVWQTPVEMVVRLNNPLLLHQLLKYGAIWSNVGYYHSNLRPRTYQRHNLPRVQLCCDAISIIMNIYSILNPDLMALYNVNFTDIAECKNLAACGRLILRDSPILKSKFLRRIVVRGYRTSNRVSIMGLINHFDQLIPGLLSHFTQPLSLKHHSKLIIRKTLNDNWQLPKGIYQLSLPRYLEHYLELLCD